MPFVVAASTNMSQFTKIIWHVGCKIPMALGEKGVRVADFVGKTAADSLKLGDSIEAMSSGIFTHKGHCKHFQGSTIRMAPSQCKSVKGVLAALDQCCTQIHGLCVSEISANIGRQIKSELLAQL